MGRDVYFMRLAFGRSSHDSPIQRQLAQLQDAGEGSSLQAPVTGGPAQNSEPVNAATENILYNVPDQQYNSRGHPSNIQSRAYGRSMRAAANDVLSVVGVVERQGADGNSNMSSQRRSEALAEENNTGTLISGITEFCLHNATQWCDVIVMRLLAYPSATSTSFTELVGQQYNEIGPLSFFFRGTIGMYAAAFVGNSGWWGSHGVVLYYIDRLVMAVFSSRDVRDSYAACRPYVAGLLDVCGNVLEMPLCLFSCLQVLDLAPNGHILPPWRSLIPFSSASPLGFGNTPLVTVMYLLYGPFSRQTATFFADTLDLSTKAIPGSRRSSGQRRHASIAGRFPSKSSDSDFSSFWQRLSAGVSRGWFTFVGGLWGVDNSPKNNGALSSTSQPASGPARSFRTGALIGTDQDISGNVAPGDLPDIRLPTDDATPTEEGTADPARQHNTNQDATIRISSIDSISGTINLEIGFPEDHPSFNAHNAAQQALHQHQNQHDEDSRSRRSSGGASASDRVAASSSSLAHEPERFFVDLNAIWLSQLTLLPVQALLYRAMAVHFAANPWPGRGGAGARGLRGLMGSSGAFGVYREMGLRGYANWMGKVGLGLMCQVAIGCGFWLLECGIVRLVGRRWFGWGKVKENAT